MTTEYRGGTSLYELYPEYIPRPSGWAIHTVHLQIPRCSGRMKAAGKEQESNCLGFDTYRSCAAPVSGSIRCIA